MDCAEEVLLGEFYDGLRQFFEETWKRPPSGEDYRYRVCLSYPCATMNEIFLQRALKKATGEEKKYLEEVRSNSFISTQNGMLSQVKELAEYYECHGAFPRILVVDLLLRDGRSWMEYMTNLTDAICEERGITKYLDPQIKSISGTYHKTLIRLSKTTKLAVFMQSIEHYDSLLCDIEQLMVWRDHKDAARTYHKFFMGMTATMVFSDVAQNGNFLPTFWMPEDDYSTISQHLREEGCSHGWRRESWRLWQKTAVIWQSGPVGQASELRLRRAVRCSFCAYTHMYAITPFIFWRIMDNRSNEVLYANVAKLLEQSGDTVFSPIVSLLKRNKQYLRPVKLQLVTTISSILVFCQFVSDGNRAEMNFSSLKTDIEKIAQCIGRAKDFALALVALTSGENKVLRDVLWSEAQKYLLANAEPLCTRNDTDAEHGKDYYLQKGEDHLYDVDLSWRQKEMYRHDNQIFYRPSSPYYEENGCLENYLDSFPEDYTSLDKIIGVLLMCLMWSLAELKMRKSNKTGRQEICLQQY